MNLTREHITLTLGINLPLNESFENLNDQLKNRILYEQMLYESFLDSVKDYAKEKWDKIITTVENWKEAAVFIGKIIDDPKLLKNFADQLWKNFKSNTYVNFKSLLEKTGLKNYIPIVNKVIDKITVLPGWQKFLAAISIASITKYIVNKSSLLQVEELKKWITTYFSDEALNNIFSKLTNFSTYVSWLQPIIKGTEILFDILKPIIDKFKTSLSFFKENINIMKKQHLKQLIEEEIKNILDKKLDEATLPEPQPKKSSPEVEKLIAYLEGSGKTALNQVNNRIELNDILTAIFNGMNDTMKKDSTAIAMVKLKDTRLK